MFHVVIHHKLIQTISVSTMKKPRKKKKNDDIENLLSLAEGESSLPCWFWMKYLASYWHIKV